ncbi:LysR family transcriptional regulator [Xinfangfangia sp. CPCC 101601]|uniref:LysR family transcriptional regulator n=1 Tax=Pseudogemmobacter lacusdianii TaxID=3069608 RepID=A0ABU0W294_9RHOB|nr:LysR family transcriptional regulator [Xinfangfangia sp. CPCC 101601]MDQ2068142.1 LysR family transcriptional regulator [Xinfangfangia sp. CPCC 101601]
MTLRSKLPSPTAIFVFEAAARLGNFSRAAQELNVTQPAVSHAISALERHLGQKLFHRSGPSLTLTVAGERLSRVTSRSFAQIETVLAEIEPARVVRETVLLSVSSGLVNHWLMPRFSAFTERFPEIDLQFQLMQSRVSGPLGTADIGLRPLSGAQSAQGLGAFCPEQIIALASPEYLQQFGPLDDPKSAHRLIEMPEHDFRWQDFLRCTGIVPHGPMSTLSLPDYSVALQAAVAGRGIVLGWTSVAAYLIHKQDLVPAASALVRTERSFHLLLGEGYRRLAVLEVRDWLLAEMARDRAEIGPILQDLPQFDRSAV